jgi:plastocyanin
MRASDDGTSVTRRIAFSTACTLAWLSLAGVAAAATYRGTLASPGVAWISDGSRPAAVSAEFAMTNKNKSFQPNLLVIPAGSNVRFPNEDPFFHSIYSDSAPDPFDIGFYDTGPGKLVSFANPGVVAVRCHIHGSMHGTIVVVDGPYAVTDKPGEAYEIENVRPGRHVLHTWTPDDGEKKTEITL